MATKCSRGRVSVIVQLRLSRVTTLPSKIRPESDGIKHSVGDDHRLPKLSARLNASKQGTYVLAARLGARTGSYWRGRHAAASRGGAGHRRPKHPTPINFRVPPGACDCHVHVFCDPRQFPFSPDRPYTPPPAPVEELRRVLRALHMDRVVIVSPAVYGASNDCTLDAIHRLGSAGRGIALIAPQTPSAERQRLRRGGT